MFEYFFKRLQTHTALMRDDKGKPKLYKNTIIYIQRIGGVIMYMFAYPNEEGIYEIYSEAMRLIRNPIKVLLGIDFSEEILTKEANKMFKIAMAVIDDIEAQRIQKKQESKGKK